MIRNGKKIKSSSKNKFDRITIIAVVVFILAGIIIFRLFDLQVLKNKEYKKMALDTRQFYEEIQPKRGEIFVKNGLSDKKTSPSGETDYSISDRKSKNSDDSSGLYPIATNIELNLLYANPSLVENPEETADKLSPLLEIPKDELIYKLSKKNDLYEPIKHYLDDEQTKAVKDLKMSGLGFVPETVRFYPEENLFSHILGFVGNKKEKQCGQYGVEEYFEDILSGKKGKITGEKDAGGRLIPTSDRSLEKAQDGADLILTIDYNIQFVACQELENAVKNSEADSGTVIVMQPQTGDILALCNYPSFDVNNYSKVNDLNIFANPAVSYAYEPGSVFKAITMAAGLDTDTVNPDSTYKDEGQVKLNGFTIQNSDLKAHGVQTMTEVLEKSLNTGAIYVVQKIGPQIFRKYVNDFGFSEPTGIELTGETVGNLSALKQTREIYAATASFGQGISVTPMQMIQSYAAIANQGKLMQPHIVDKIINSDGTIIQNEPKFIREVLKPSTAATLSAMLVSVVKNGHAKGANVDGYYVAGKTGTAQVPNKNTRGYSDQTIHSFIGFAPATNPRFIAMIKLDNPKKGRFAESTAIPAFGKIAKFMLNYYEIAPDY